MQTIEKNEFQDWERNYRTNFVNSLTGFKSVGLIGTVNEDGITNLAIFSSLVHLGSNPALIGFINRPLTATSHTFKNIKTNGVYTINHIHDAIIDVAHKTGEKYPDGVSEFDEVGLTTQFIDGIQVPFVKESRVKYLLELKEIIPIQWNDTFLVIGGLEKVIIEDQIISEDGFLNINESKSVCSNGLDAYYQTELIKRIPRA
jgi:flavin reductase (DIM6/NTAB) family NADH-FMN oxidoreductase RutF